MPENLLDCGLYNCSSRYFNCRMYYCIPWRYVCNSVWDCPWGTDELGCQRTSCPGYFKCHQSVICLVTENICDHNIDCKFGDDEYYCQIEIPSCAEEGIWSLQLCNSIPNIDVSFHLTCHYNHIFYCTHHYFQYIHHHPGNQKNLDDYNIHKDHCVHLTCHSNLLMTD